MKMRLPGIVLLLACCAVGIACVSSPHQTVYTQPVAAPVAPSGAEGQPFYGDLAPYGRWVYVSGPGWSWSPYDAPAGWRPYQLGRWVFTDYGWTWASEESFGWAVYHYGRWHQTPAYGWVWVPGTEWGPAWVAWHEGGGWVGWAPLPWQVRWRAGVGLDWGGLSVNVALGPSSWYFVQARDLVAPSLRSRIVPAYRNVTLIQITQHVTNYTYIDNRIVDQSVRVEKIGRAVGHTIPRYRVRPAEPSEAAQGGRVRGQDFVVFRPNTVRGAKSQGRLVPPGRERMNRPDEAPQGTPPEATEPKRESSSKPGKTEHQPSRFLRDLEQRRNRARDARGSAPDQGAVPATPSETRSDGRTPPPRTGPANAQPDKPAQAATPPVKPGQSKSQAATSKAKKPGEAPPKPRKPKPGASDSAGSDSEKPKPETPEPENQP